MKNIMKKLIALSLAIVMLSALVSCDKSSTVKKAFEDAGYEVKTVNAENDEVKSILKLLLSEAQIEELSAYEVYYFSMDGVLNLLKKAVVIRFPSSGELAEFLTVTAEDGTKDTSKLDKAKADGWVNGNCLILTASSDCLSVFKAA